METKATLKLMPVERSMAVDAMKTYRQKLQGWTLKQFDIVYNKICESKNGVVKLDGMEMEYLKRALNVQGWLFYQDRRKAKANTFFSLAYWVKEQKRMFQDKHNPLKQKNIAVIAQ